MSRTMEGINSVQGVNRSTGILQMNTKQTTNVMQEMAHNELSGFNGKGLIVPVTYSSNGVFNSKNADKNKKEEQSFDKYF